MKQTSVQAYRQMRKSKELGKRQKKVYKAVKRYGPGTMREIYQFMGEPGVYSGYQPRFKELRDKNLLQESGKKQCNITGRKATIYEIKRRLIFK